LKLIPITNDRVEIASRLSHLEAIASLQSHLRPGDMTGRATPSEIVLKLDSGPVSQRSQPIFRGKVSVVGDTIVLTGSIQTPPNLKLFMAFWFGVGLVGTLGAFISTQRQGQDRLVPLIGVGMLLCGLAFFHLLNRHIKRGSEGLELTLREALAPVA
jgi:hypothetical protein